MARTDAEILGREDVNDLDAILEITNTDMDEAIHVVKNNADSIFTWDYERSRVPLMKLYEKAKTSMWNGETDLDWSIEVDNEKLARENPLTPTVELIAEIGVDLSGTVLAKWTNDDWVKFEIERINWSLSQFMHGEQGALVCTAKIVETVPWIDAKYYAATQVMDEARHVEVFAKYLDTKLDGHYAINHHLKMLLDDIVEDSRWDMTYLGMSRSRCVRHGPSDHRRSPPQATPSLRHERRSPTCGLRRADAQGVLRGSHLGRAARPSGVRVRGRGAHA